MLHRLLFKLWTMTRKRPKMSLPEENRCYTYVIVRKDIPHTYRIIQAAHAVQMAMLEYPYKIDPKTPIHMVLLEAKNEDELIKIFFELNEQDIKTSLFFEPDYDTGYTALASAPIHWADDSVRKPFKKYRFYK